MLAGGEHVRAVSVPPTFVDGVPSLPKHTMRQTLLKIHRWGGLAAGLAIFVIAISGCALVFEDDIDRLLNPDLTVVAPGPSTVSLQAVVEAVRSAYPSEVLTGIVLPKEPHHALVINLQSGQSVSFDQYAGRLLGARERLGGFARLLRRLHKTLLAGSTGQKIVGCLALLTLLMAVSGVILWWPRRILALRSSPSWRRVNFDLHNVLGLYSAAFLVVMCVSGVMITFADVVDPLVLRLDEASTREAVSPAPNVPDGGALIGPDEAVKLGRAALPGAFIRRVGLPRPGTASYLLGVGFPEDRTPGGRSRVTLDQYNGQVLEVQDARTAPLGRKILDLKRSIHTGDVFGAPSRALAFVVSLMLAGQVVTGLLVWWRPGKLGAAARIRAHGEVRGRDAEP